MVNSYPGTGPRVDNANYETSLSSSYAIFDKLMEKDDENVWLRDNRREPNHAQQQKSSDTGQG